MEEDEGKKFDEFMESDGVLSEKKKKKKKKKKKTKVQLFYIKKVNLKI